MLGKSECSEAETEGLVVLTYCVPLGTPLFTSFFTRALISFGRENQIPLLQVAAREAARRLSVFVSSAELGSFL